MTISQSKFYLGVSPAKACGSCGEFQVNFVNPAYAPKIN